MSIRVRLTGTGRRVQARALVLLLAGALGGCVIVPYKPGADVAVQADVQVDAQNFLVTEGPRAELDRFTEALADEDRGITIVPRREFLDVAFVDEDASLARMLEAQTCARVRAALGADFLVLVAEVQDYKTDEAGEVVPYLGFYGAMKSRDHTVAAATIIDLERAEPLCDINAHAQGMMAGVGAFYGLFVVPMTDSSARDGLAQGIVTALRERAGPRPLKVAVLAAEKLPGAAPAVPAAAPADDGSLQQ